MDNKHTITSFEDVCNTITMENMEAFLADLKKCIETYVATVKIIKAMHPEATEGKKNWEISQLKYTWIDDGKNDLKAMHFTHKDGNSKTVNFES
jgi:hypothetical protein